MTVQGWGLVGHVALLLVLLIWHHVRQLPVFTVFVGFQILTTVVLFLVFRSGTRDAYFDVYWGGAAIDLLLQLAVVYELAQDVLQPTGTWVKDARDEFFSWGVAGIIGASALTALMGLPETKGLDLLSARATLFSSLVTCGVFVAFSSVASRLGLHSRDHVVALGQGLFIWAFVGLLNDFGHILFGWSRDFLVLV